MSSIQERLQLKRIPLDSWNVREQLCLASAVVRSGDQNWMSVSRALKAVGDPSRPHDWYSQKSCAAQYEALLEHVDTPKRKKRNSEGAGETPQETIVKRLTQERIEEIQRTVAEMTQQYHALKTEISEARNPLTSEDRIKEMWSSIEAANRARERETARRAAWLREREERRARVERGWRPGGGSPGGTTPAPPSSPLLTSLLKSSPTVTTPQLMPHPATVVETLSPSAGAPTLSMLLEKPSERDHKTAAIEHIKSQLVQIERQLQEEPPAAVDIDDIEINAEDVYAFRDVDIHIPGATHTRTSEKPILPKKEEDDTPTPTTQTDSGENTQDDVSIKETTSTEETTNVETPEESTSLDTQKAETDVEIPASGGTSGIKLSFPEVKFPTLEIKVIQPDDPKQVKDEPEEVVKEPESLPTQDAVETQTEVEQVVAAPSVEEKPQSTETTQKESVDSIPPEPMEVETVPEVAVESSPPVEEDSTVVEDKEHVTTADQDNVASVTSAEEQPLQDIAPETEADQQPEVLKTEDVPDDVADETVEHDIKMEDNESNIVPGEAETDDDTPMEVRRALSREEDKDGKKKRDYSRKKKPESRTCSGSDSPTPTSGPPSPSPGPLPMSPNIPAESPAQIHGSTSTQTSVSSEDRQHRLWKKSVMLVHQRLCSHKYASLFLRRISDELAPGYSVAVKRPVDLASIRRNIDNGTIRSTSQFHRDVLLMLTNALMYNSKRHRVYDMARDMLDEAGREIKVLVAAHAHAGLAPRRRRHNT